ncbi:hypothetical protein LTR86_000742 [Recurvomyces mirabilis]|nr:hypothetical protein LTR86_000742 [Recurvomyces mirabilis]
MAEHSRAPAPSSNEPPSLAAGVSAVTTSRITSTQTLDTPDPTQAASLINHPASAGSHRATQARVLRQPFQFRSSNAAPRSATAPPRAAPFRRPGEPGSNNSPEVVRQQLIILYKTILSKLHNAIASRYIIASRHTIGRYTISHHTTSSTRTTTSSQTIHHGTHNSTTDPSTPPPPINPFASSPTPPLDIEPTVFNPNIPSQVPCLRIPLTHYRSFHDPSNPWTSIIRPDPSTLDPNSPSHLQDKLAMNVEIARYHGIRTGDTHWFYPGGKCWGRTFGGKEEFGYHDPYGGVKKCRACERMQIPDEVVLTRIHEQYGGGKREGRNDEAIDREDGEVEDGKV